MKNENPLLAYFDTIGFGLIPCRIVGYEHDDWTDNDRCIVELTASRGRYQTYKRGERIHCGLNEIVSRRTRQQFPHTYVHTVDHDAARAALMG